MTEVTLGELVREFKSYCTVWRSVLYDQKLPEKAKRMINQVLMHRLALGAL